MEIHVCHLTSVHTRADKRIFKMCYSLATAGYKVTLLCADNMPNEVRDNVSIISTSFRPKNRLQRIINSKRIMLEGALKIDADIYHFHDPELIPVGLELKKCGKKVIYDSHEDYPIKILFKYWIPKFLRPLISKLFKGYEENAVKRFDAVISVTPQIVGRFVLINNRAVLITNFPRIADMAEDTNGLCVKEKMICFAGGISPDRMHHIIIKALEIVPAVKYYLAGTGNGKYIRELEKLPMWSNVKYFGQLPYNKVMQIYDQAVAGVVIEDYNPCDFGTEGSLGVTKLFEYMSVGLPVICTNFIYYKGIVEENNCGICLKPYDIHAVAEAIKYIIDHPEEAQRMGENGRRAVIEKYNWGTQEKTLLELYGELSNNVC